MLTKSVVCNIVDIGRTPFILLAAFRESKLLVEIVKLMLYTVTRTLGLSLSFL